MSGTRSLPCHSAVSSLWHHRRRSPPCILPFRRRSPPCILSFRRSLFSATAGCSPVAFCNSLRHGGGGVAAADISIYPTTINDVYEVTHRPTHPSASLLFAPLWTGLPAPPQNPMLCPVPTTADIPSGASLLGQHRGRPEPCGDPVERPGAAADDAGCGPDRQRKQAVDSRAVGHPRCFLRWRWVKEPRVFHGQYKRCAFHPRRRLNTEASGGNVGVSEDGG